MYICNLCDYKTESRTSLCNHNKTKKHLKNKELNNKQINEEIEILKLKETEILKLKENEIIKENKIEKLKQELLNKDKAIIQLETKVEIYKELSEKTKTINNNNKIVINNNLSYVNKHFENAPPLQKMTNFVLN